LGVEIKTSIVFAYPEYKLPNADSISP
jgi:hypothetical protein